MNGIHNIKGKTSVNILVSNYSNKHVTFNKGEYVGHLEPTIENIDEEENLHPHGNPDAHTTSSVTTKKMISEQVEPNVFEPPCHKLKPNIDAKLDEIEKATYSQSDLRKLIKLVSNHPSCTKRRWSKMFSN